MNADPTGLACGTGLCVAGGIAARALYSYFTRSAAVGTAAVVVSQNEKDFQSDKSLSRSEIVQKAQENRLKNRVCKQKEPPTGDLCQDAKNNLERLKLCLQLREDFSRKWFNNDGTHALEISNTKAAVENAKNAVKLHCGEEDCE